MAIKPERKYVRRHRHLVSFGLQFRYMVLIIAGMLIPMLIVAGVLFGVFWQSITQETPIPEGAHQFIVTVLANTSITLLILVPVVCALILWAALILSHRIAGPLIRLEKEIRGMTEKRKFSRLRIRKADELSSLAEAINTFIEESRKN